MGIFIYALVGSTAAATMRKGCDQVSRYSSALGYARCLDPPAPILKHGGEYESLEFWTENHETLQSAWREFGLNDSLLAALDEEASILPSLREAVRRVRGNPPCPANEAAVLRLFEQPIPGVFKFRLFTDAFLSKLRIQLGRLKGSGIPIRRPNGMNRYGLILSVGDGGDQALGGLLTPLLRDVANAYIRPLARSLFPEYIGRGDDEEMYAFSIRYSAGGDLHLAEHRDASVVTFNANVDPHEDALGYGGSELEFVDENNPMLRRRMRFEPGYAIIHKGGHRHQTLPLEYGERNNLVVWLHGKGGYVRSARYPPDERLSYDERWTEAPRRSGIF